MYRQRRNWTRNAGSLEAGRPFGQLAGHTVIVRGKVWTLPNDIVSDSKGACPVRVSPELLGTVVTRHLAGGPTVPSRKCGVRPRAHTRVPCRRSDACAEQAAWQELRVKDDDVPPPRGQVSRATVTTPPVRGAPGGGDPRLGSTGDTPSSAPSQGEDRRGLPEDTGCEPRVPTRGESTQAEGMCPGRRDGHRGCVRETRGHKRSRSRGCRPRGAGKGARRRRGGGTAGEAGLRAPLLRGLQQGDAEGTRRGPWPDSTGQRGPVTTKP